MIKIVDYNSFISINNGLLENASLNNKYSDDINEAIDSKKTLMEYVHRELYGRLITRILGSNNKNLETIIKSDDTGRASDFKASELFKPIWSKIEKYSNPNSTESSANILKDLQNDFRTDLNILESLSPLNIVNDNSTDSSTQDLKNPDVIVKLANEGNLINVLNSKGVFNTLTDSQKRVFETINDKKEFINSLKTKLLSSLNNDSTMGLRVEIIYRYGMTPGFKQAKSLKSSLEPNHIGHLLVLDISILAYRYYIERLSEIISNKVVDTEQTIKTDTEVKTITTETKPRKIKTRTTAEYRQSEFKPEYLKNFGY